MRGSDGMQEALFTVAKLEDFVPANHPLRPIPASTSLHREHEHGINNDQYACDVYAWANFNSLLAPLMVWGAAPRPASLGVCVWASAS